MALNLTDTRTLLALIGGRVPPDADNRALRSVNRQGTAMPQQWLRVRWQDRYGHKATTVIPMKNMESPGYANEMVLDLAAVSNAAVLEAHYVRTLLTQIRGPNPGQTATVWDVATLRMQTTGPLPYTIPILSPDGIFKPDDNTVNLLEPRLEYLIDWLTMHGTDPSGHDITGASGGIRSGNFPRKDR